MNRTRRVLAIVAAAWLALVVVAIAWPGLFSHADPLLVDMSDALSPPSAEHPFGTDQSGRDVLSRVVHGARLSVGVGVLATALAVMSGLVVGVLIGLAPRIVDTIVMRIVDVALAIPEFLVALVIVALLGPGSQNVAIAVTFAAAPVYVRYARAHTRSLRQEEFVQAATLIGVPRPLVVTRHIVPGVLRRLSVLATLGLGTSILAIAGLSFLGLGVSEPTPEWGLILSSGRNVLGRAWWIAVFPGVAITLTVLAAGVLGRAAREFVEGEAR